MELIQFLEYAEHLYYFIGLMLTYWPITLVLAMVYTMYKTWTYYLAVMSLHALKLELDKKGEDFTIEQKLFGYPALLKGGAWDVFLNLFVGTIVFFEIPKYLRGEFLFTGRVSRWKETGGWRGDLARWFCNKYLDPFQLGGHCGR